MLNDIRSDLTTNFVDEFGVSETSAAMAVHLYLAVTSSVHGEEAQAHEFQRALQQVAAQGEAWALELLTKILEKRLPAYRTTYQHALAHGKEPSTALMRTHSLPAEAAHELITLFTGESASGDEEQRDAPSARPVMADIQCFNGQVTVTIDPTATVASARVHTKDTSGPSAKAARDATIRLAGDQLTVTVPEPESTLIGNSHFGSGTVFQNVSSVGDGMTMTGLTMDRNGNMTAGGISRAVNASPIEIDVTLPPGSGVKLRGRNADLTVNGPLAALDINTSNGDLRAGILGKAKIRTRNGGSTIDAIQDWIDSETYNGTTTIGTYSGNDARLITHNGGIHLTASRHARHGINARSYNGPITLRGVVGRTDLQVTTKSYNGHISES
ncbi:hypothetical protein ABZ851_30165 [Streptomyces sp. NPDC047049]|uniref:hypothetical protein n=1 Tax=Streptomyces sp. NPDC047049 TaxID=3156688 RepID=UPI0033D54E1A